MKASGWHRKALNTPAELARKAEYASPEFQATTRALVAEVARGRSGCWRCGVWINPAARGPRGERVWHVGHDDYDRTIIRGAECRDCNLKKAASKGARVRNGSGGTGPTRISL